MSDCYDDPICKECGTDTAAVEQMLREAQERCERLEKVGRLLQEWVDGIVADFDGVTDDANDPYRLHTWDDLERCERPVPDFHADLSEPDEMMQEGKL